MKKMKRFLAMILATTMLVSTDAVSVLATEPTETTEPAETTEVTEITEPTETTEIPPNGYMELPREDETPEVRYDLLVDASTPQLYNAVQDSYYVNPNMPAIRDQYPYGTCWSFASVALAELDLLQNGMSEKDLSELHLAYFTYHSVEDPLGGTAGDVTQNEASNVFNIGGNLLFSSRALMNWMGYVDETTVPYGSVQSALTSGLDESLAYADTVHLKNVYYINMELNPEIVKAMIKEYGGVAISYYAGDAYCAEYNSYYDSTYTTSNHAVTIVGWDDDFPAEHFNTPAPGNGAWLIRNSWGGDGNTDYCEYGYFWLSYYDTSITNTAYVFDATVEGAEDFYDNNYQYDGGIYDVGLYLSSSEITAANVFKAHSGAQNEILKAVSFATTGANQAYEVNVYRGLNDTNNPQSGTLVATQEGKCDYAGIYTIDLANPVSVQKDETFSVVVTITSRIDGGYARINAERTYSYSPIISEVSSCAGQSFYKDGGLWYDYGKSGDGNICIKAYTVDSEGTIAATGVTIQNENVELGVGETAQLVAKVAPATASNQKVTWESSDSSIVTVDTIGKVTAHQIGRAEITVTTEDGGFTDKIEINVTNKPTSISFSEEEIEVVLHETAALTINMEPEGATTEETISWSSSESSIASVDDNGVVTANGYGYCFITASVAGKEAECMVRVIPPKTVLTASAWSENGIDLSWTDVEGITAYDLYRYDYNHSQTELLNRVSADVTTYTDNTLASSTRYMYYVVSEYDNPDIGYYAESRSNTEYNKYTITYVMNDGTNAESNPSAFSWNQAKFSLAKPQHESAVFEGWYYDNAFTKAVGDIIPYSTLKNITVYAKWRERIEIQSDWLIYNEIQDYTGAEFRPAIAVNDGSKTLEKGTDYEVSYYNVTVNGVTTCDVTVTGIGEYIGSQTVTITERKATLQDDMVNEIPSLTFTGTAVTPKPEVTFNGTALEENIDYMVSYGNNVNVGTATVTITGTGHFEGSVTKNFKIQAKALERGFASAVAEQVYTGAAIEPEIVLTYNGKNLQKNTDYTISYRDNMQTGLATATLKGKGNYYGTVTVTFTIAGADLATLEAQDALGVLIGGTDTYEVLYSGEAIAPDINVILSDGTQLKEGTDYAVSYTDNRMPGMAKVAISGLGNYTGTLEKTFTIKPYNIADADITLGKRITVLYTPKGQTPQPKVMDGTKRLTEGEDYTAAYYRLNDSGMREGAELAKVTDAGRYELLLKGIGVYTGTFEHAAEITVKARSLETGNITIDSPYARIDGEVVTANYKLWYHNQLLTEGVDYTAIPVISESRQYVTYVFEGKGNYAGILTQKFPLIAADIILFSEGEYQIRAIADQTYTGEEICPAVVVERIDGSSTLTEGIDYTVTYRKNVDAGTAAVAVTGVGKCVGTQKATFHILPMDAGAVEAELLDDAFTYDTTNHMPKAYVHTATSVLKEGTDYTISDTECKNAGAHQAVITLRGNYAGTMTLDYEILPENVSELLVSIPQQTYTGTEILPAISDMTISLQGKQLSAEEKNGLHVVSGTNNQKVSGGSMAEVTISGTGNFTGEKTFAFQIVKKDISDPDFTIKIEGESDTGYQTEWTGSERTPEIEIWYGLRKLVQDEDYSLTYRYNTEVGTARMIVSGINNYMGSRVIFFEIVGTYLSEENGYMISLEEDTFLYNGKSHCPAVSVSNGEKLLSEGTDYDVTYEENINAGTAKATVTGVGHYTGSMSKEFTIAKKTTQNANSVKVGTIGRQRYTRERLLPDTTIEIDGEKLVKGKDYTITVLNGVDVGIATWTATGIGNYDGVLSEQQFEIYCTTITYVLNGGVNSEKNPSYYTASDSITLADPTREDYIFDGWYSDKACTNRVYGIKAGSNGDKTFYAKWIVPKQVYGMDVSKWQGNIDWNTVGRTDKTFAMIRLSHGTSLDPFFETNYSGARNAGIKVGVYCYNEASTIQGAINEANYVLTVLNGRKLDYPVAYDLERVTGISNALRTDMVYAFKNVIENAGYEFILYANKNWMEHYFDSARLAPLDLWIARYCDYNLGHQYTGPGNVRIWQYSDSGSVNGISGNVDLDVCYSDYGRK